MMNKLSLLLFSILLMTGAAASAGEAPSKILIIGDSMMRITAHALEIEAAKHPGVEVRSFTSLGSGIARLDVFDWMAKADELVATFKPEVTIAWFGTNDRQPLQTKDGVLQPGTPAWDAEYSRRVGALMDKLAPAEGARVVWLELPHMRDAIMQADVAAINTLVKAEADRRDRIEFFQTRSILNRKAEVFSPYVVGPKGMPMEVRDTDGVHLNRAGADLMASRLLKHLLDGEATKDQP